MTLQAYYHQRPKVNLWDVPAHAGLNTWKERMFFGFMTSLKLLRWQGSGCPGASWSLAAFQRRHVPLSYLPAPSLACRTIGIVGFQLPEPGRSAPRSMFNQRYRDLLCFRSDVRRINASSAPAALLLCNHRDGQSRIRVRLTHSGC